MSGVVGSERKTITKRAEMPLANALSAKGGYLWKTGNETYKCSKILIDGYIITLDLQEVKGHTAQLQKIGANVDQIAKRINETGRIYADDIDEIKRVMEEVWRLERRLLLQFKGLTK